MDRMTPNPRIYQMLGSNLLPFSSFWVDDPQVTLVHGCPAQTGQNFFRFNTNQPHHPTNQAAGMLGIFWPFLRMPRFQRKRNSLIAFLGWLPKVGPGKKEKKSRTQNLTRADAGSTSRANLLEAQHCQPQANLNYSMNMGKTHDFSATLPQPPLASVPGQTRSASDKL